MDCTNPNFNSFNSGEIKSGQIEKLTTYQALSDLKISVFPYLKIVNDQLPSPDGNYYSNYCNQNKIAEYAKIEKDKQIDFNCECDSNEQRFIGYGLVKPEVKKSFNLSVTSHNIDRLNNLCINYEPVNNIIQYTFKPGKYIFSYGKLQIDGKVLCLVNNSLNEYPSTEFIFEKTKSYNLSPIFEIKSSQKNNSITNTSVVSNGPFKNGVPFCVNDKIFSNNEPLDYRKISAIDFDKSDLNLVCSANVNEFFPANTYKAEYTFDYIPRGFNIKQLPDQEYLKETNFVVSDVEIAKICMDFNIIELKNRITNIDYNPKFTPNKSHAFSLVDEMGKCTKDESFIVREFTEDGSYVQVNGRIKLNLEDFKKINNCKTANLIINKVVNYQTPMLTRTGASKNNITFQLLAIFSCFLFGLIKYLIKNKSID